MRPDNDNDKIVIPKEDVPSGGNSGKKDMLNEDGSIPTNLLSSTVFSSMSTIPFSNLIANPLKACVAAQADCNNAVLKYMQKVAFGTPKQDDKPSSVVKFEFDFIKNGKINKLSVPLITLVPINYFTIDKIKMHFKASINASNNSSSANQTIESEISSTKKKEEEKKLLGGEKKDGGNNSTLDKIKAVAQKLMPTVNKLVGSDSGKPVSNNGDNTTYSSKKDSKSTRDSKYSVETTIDFEISAVPSDMPAGLSKMLEVLSGTISVVDPEGKLLEVESEDAEQSKEGGLNDGN